MPIDLNMGALDGALQNYFAGERREMLLILLGAAAVTKIRPGFLGHRPDSRRRGHLEPAPRGWPGARAGLRAHRRAALRRPGAGGLIWKAVEDAQFESEVDTLLKRLAAGPTRGLAAAKCAIRSACCPCRWPGPAAPVASTAGLFHRSGGYWRGLTQEA